MCPGKDKLEQLRYCFIELFSCVLNIKNMLFSLKLLIACWILLYVLTGWFLAKTSTFCFLQLNTLIVILLSLTIFSLLLSPYCTLTDNIWTNFTLMNTPWDYNLLSLSYSLVRPHVQITSIPTHWKCKQNVVSHKISVTLESILTKETETNNCTIVQLHITVNYSNICSYFVCSVVFINIGIAYVLIWFALSLSHV